MEENPYKAPSGRTDDPSTRLKIEVPTWLAVFVIVLAAFSALYAAYRWIAFQAFGVGES